MQHVVTGMFLKSSLAGPGAPPLSAADPIVAAAAAIEHCLAQAHEAGNDDAVRLLHAVSAILAASPRT